jgi:propionyl-CoA carboxylase beta chain
MGPSGATEILYSAELKACKSEEERNALKAKLSAEYAERFASPYQTASTGSIDEVIEPSQMRYKVIRALRFLKDKRQPGSHENRGNIPL